MGERGNPKLRQADRLIGIPAVYLAGIVRRFSRGALPEDPRIIGLLKASGIGDAVILSGVIADVRARYPHATIVLFSGTSNHAFAKLLDGPDEVVALPVRRPLAALRMVRARKPEIMIDFGMWPRLEALIASLSGARFVIGVATPDQHRHHAFDAVARHSSGHEIENYRNLAALAGVTSTTMPYLRSGLGAASPLQRPYVVLHLWPGGANSEERSWPNERWFELARTLAARGATLVFTGGSEDAEPARALAASWNQAGLEVRSIAGESAAETIVWLRHARGTISVNTGVLHVSAALGTPTVALNGPTSGRRWGPLGPHVRSVSSPMVPDGYLNLGWERDERYATCMQAISVGAVLAAWDDLQAEVASVRA